ncbi:MAG TPA: ABC transporter substrate-binding protein, partial [Polyangiaceae bacterium]|nr:ABC transporter substrate-binding protein [Polyangiaceae bacterium]
DVEPTGLGALGYDAAAVLFAAMERAGTVDSDAVRIALGKTKDFEGVSGKITINSHRDAEKSAVVIKIEGGKGKYETTVEP